MKKAILAWAAVLVMLSCGPKPPSAAELLAQRVQARLAQMTLEQKVGQLFYVRVESLLDTLPVGGVVLFGKDVRDSAQLKALVDSLHALPFQPLVCIDEEGGRVARIGNNKAFNVPRFASMAAVGASGKPQDAYACGNAIGSYLKDFGIDIDLAPVADVNTNPANPVIGNRAFSGDPAVAAPMVSAYLRGLQDAGVLGCIKHFPGHGDTRTDTHYGYAQSLKTWEEMLSCEMLPFKAGIDWGVPMVMTAHIAVPKVTGTLEPSTVSSLMLTEKLRGELGFEGVIVTDGMGMGAITRQYRSGEAAVKALQAGADIILLPEDLQEAYDAVLAAVADSTLTAARLDASVSRILTLRFMGKESN